MMPPVQLVKLNASEITVLPARIAASTAPAVPGAPVDEHGQQMAVGVARVAAPGDPTVAVTLVFGRVQIALSLDAAEADKFCHALADAVLWQNDQLRQKAGQVVH
jgi:hypothetical protein